jgi:hypothetical protein
MNTYKRHRIPPDIISYAVWLYFRFNLKRVVTAIEILKIYLLNAVSLYPEKRFSSGAWGKWGVLTFPTAHLVQRTPETHE